MATFAAARQRTPQRGQRKEVVAAAPASPEEIDAVLARIADVVAAAPGGVDAGVLPARYAAAHGAPLARTYPPRSDNGLTWSVSASRSGDGAPSPRCSAPAMAGREAAPAGAARPKPC